MHEDEGMLNYNLSKSKEIKFMIECGFNIFIYGAGSKWDFIKSFQVLNLNDGPTIVINGFNPAVNSRNIFT